MKLPLLLLLLFCVCFCRGDRKHNKKYGESVEMMFFKWTEFVKFTPEHGSARLIWSLGDTSNSSQHKGRMVNKVSAIYRFYKMDHLTQKDSGTYEALDPYYVGLNSVTLKVEAWTMSHELPYNNYYDDSFPFAGDDCNIYFTPKKWEGSGTNWSFVMKGRQLSSTIGVCDAFNFREPCEISIHGFTTECSGRYDVMDKNNNLGYSVKLMTKEELFENVPVLVVSVVVCVVALMCCCCCIKCCKKSKKRETADIVATNDPAPSYNQYQHEPAVLRRDEVSQPTATTYPVHPSSSTSPMIHNTSMNAPPSYSEVSVPSQPLHNPTVSYSAYPSAPISDPAVTFSFTSSLSPPPPPDPTIPDHSGPTAPLFTNTMPQFELKGYDFTASPLGSNSDHTSVYTSDKLNFL